MLGRVFGPRMRTASPDTLRIVSVDVPVFAALMLAVSAVLSLVAIIAIYREGGILRRLRATPLRPYTILIAHVMVKLILTAATIALMFLAGRRDYPVAATVPLASFTLAVLSATVVHSVAGLPDREPGADGPIRSAARDVDSVPHVRDFRALHSARPHAAAAADHRAGDAIQLRGVLASGDLARRRLGCSCRRSAGHGRMFLVFTAVSTRVFRWE